MYFVFTITHNANAHSCEHNTKRVALLRLRVSLSRRDTVRRKKCPENNGFYQTLSILQAYSILEQYSNNRRGKIFLADSCYCYTGLKHEQLVMKAIAYGFIEVANQNDFHHLFTRPKLKPSTLQIITNR